MGEKKVKKINIALEYLNLACELYCEEKNLFSAIHLAAAAEEIFGQYCKKITLKPVEVIGKI